MKNIFLISALASTTLISSAAHALTINQTGGFDTLISSTTLPNSGDATEKAWVESALETYLGIASVDATLGVKDNSGSTNWTLASDSLSDDGFNDDYYYNFGTDSNNVEIEPDYYLLKFGTGGTNGRPSSGGRIESHYLFENIGDLNYAMVDFSQATDVANFSVGSVNIGKLSHTNTYNVGGSVVPEPSTYAMFGLAGVILAFMRYRSRNSKS